MTKRAVIVGVDDYTIQFPDGKSNLHGCLADAQSMGQLLVDVFGFDASQLSTYLDANASRTNILQAVQQMISASQPGDVACFFYAGHGARVGDPAASADPNRYYEAIVPAAGDWITDLEVFSLADTLQPSEVNLTIILDCCHSGGFHEAAPDMRTRTIDFDQALIQAMVQFMDTIIPCGVCLSPDATVMNGNVSQVTGQGNGVVCSVDDNKSLVPLSKSTVIAACRYDEVDLETGGHGALTQGFLDLINASGFQISYSDLIDQLRADMQSRQLTQTPTLLGQQNRVTEGFLQGWTGSA